MAKFVDHSGRRFGFLTALEPTRKALSSGRLMPSWRLRCDCGKEVTAMTVNLVKGKHKSCGCKSRDLQLETYFVRHPRKLKARPEKLRRTSVTKLPEYRIYRQMLDRCYLVTAPNYQYYGAKGVSVCDRWRFGEGDKTGFFCFYDDMGERPDGLTLDRINPFEGYGPDNCEWATWGHQAKNKREHHMSDAERSELSKRRSIKARKKCSDEVILDVLDRLADGQRQVSIASDLGIGQQTVSRINTGQMVPISEMGS